MMTTRSRFTRRLSAWAATLVLGAAMLAGCGGGGGGGGGDGGNGGGNEGPIDAELGACQSTVSAAGATALADRLAAADTCGDVVACQIRDDVDGTDPTACLDAASASCTSALDAASDPRAAVLGALNGPACAELTIGDLAGTLGFDTLAPRCATVGGAVDSKESLATCLGATVECAGADALAASAPLAFGLLNGEGVQFTDKTCGAATLGIHVGTVVTGEGGAQFDGIVDGFPGIAPLDGTPDVAGNQLGVGLKPGSTEERGIAEFPVATVTGGLAAGAITSVVLHFNVDDVLSTFGPGTDFDGTASERIQIHVYSGDGSVLLADFAEGNGAPDEVVTTGAQGAITDATLGSTGPVFFEVDLTSQVKALLAAGATHIGVVFATDDANSGTSIDDLGANSAGPPGVGGAKLPFFVVNGGEEPDPVCGDGTTDPGEECDDGNRDPGDGCDANCQDEPPPVACGNGVPDTGEECDDGANNSDTAPNACRTNCRNARCGDDVNDTGEQCDDGNANSDTAKDACRTDCRSAVCGDGVVDTGEQCDPPGQSCSATCETITVDAAAQFIACQEALLGAAARAQAEAGSSIGACLAAEVGCTLADADAASCRANADNQCTSAANALAAARVAFRDDFPSACVGRPPAELVLALGFTDAIADCAADGLPTTTLGDVADCVFRDASCPVTRAYGELAAGGAASLVGRGALPAELVCAGAP
jgi:cysteine-rich repeat protein